jgi:uncharacterized protein (DUF3084 family)
MKLNCSWWVSEVLTLNIHLDDVFQQAALVQQQAQAQLDAERQALHAEQAQADVAVRQLEAERARLRKEQEAALLQGRLAVWLLYRHCDGG